MKQIVIISGKGGTGKTILTGAFAALAENKVIADCDVDAADMHLLLNPEIKEKQLFKSGVTAFINMDKCVRCRKCLKLCRYEAIHYDAEDMKFFIDEISCEGCSFCSNACPEQAIEMRENETGDWYISSTRLGTLVHAKLGIGEENSGKLVALVREKAKEVAKKQNSEWIIIDGPPGIGCPVIASITGIDCALVVTEPTLSGLNDASRVIDVANHFKVPVKLIINKYDLNLKMTQTIEDYCANNNISLLGKIPFDEEVVKAMVNGKTIMENATNETTEIIRGIWQQVASHCR